MNTTNKREGFTIIEVVLVLAIAGLIFLMVFFALPALQRSQRDTQRRDDLSRFASQLTSYSTNNKGSLPGSDDLDNFKANYLKWAAGSDGEYNDPKSGEAYNIEVGTDAPSEVGDITYGGPDTNCDKETIVTGGGDRQAAVSIKLEGSGVFCQNVQQ